VACRAISEQIKGLPIFTSDDYDMYQLVSILRQAAYMVSSRYHGIVTCMPSLVASAGVTMDERIRNLMRERGHKQPLRRCGRSRPWTENVGDDGKRLLRKRNRSAKASGKPWSAILKVMGAHGGDLRRPYAAAISGISIAWRRPLVGGISAPLSENLVRLAEKYDVAEAAMVASK